MVVPHNAECLQGPAGASLAAEAAGFDPLPEVLEGVLEEGQLPEEDAEDSAGLGEAPEESQVDSEGRSFTPGRTQNANQEQVTTTMSTAGWICPRIFVRHMRLNLNATSHLGNAVLTG